MAKKRVFTVGPNTQFIGHTKDKVNYYPGQTFGLDHLDEEMQEILIARGAVADVTGMKPDAIKKMVAEYKKFTQAEIAEKLREVASAES